MPPTDSQIMKVTDAKQRVVYAPPPPPPADHKMSGALCHGLCVGVLLQPPFWIWFPSIRRQTPGLIDPIFLWLIGGDYMPKVPFDDLLCRSSKVAAPAAILDLVSVNFLTKCLGRLV
jgi:hypothetical protein